MKMEHGAKTAVLLVAHGSPDRAEEIPEFLRHVTGGRALPNTVIEEITHRYSRIGFSPLTSWTRKQAEQLGRLLHMPVYFGMRNWKPFISEAAAAMAAQAINRVIAICLAPQNSRTSVGLYRRALVDQVEPNCPVDFIESWHDHPLLVQAFAEKLRPGWERARQEAGKPPRVIFTAHSVPEHTIHTGDPYAAQAWETAERVASRAGFSTADYVLAFQSQGMSGGPWIGPTVEDTILGLKQKGHGNVFIQPIGFVCDHVEILYDIDVLFKDFAEKHGMRLWRAESLNDSPTLTAALADLVRVRLNVLEGSRA